MAEPLLEMEQVEVVRGGRSVLRVGHLQVECGECVVILGPNGCGKSTLIKTITRELYPLATDETQVKIFGRERWDLTELRQRLGVVQAELPGKPMLHCTGLDAMLTGFFSSSTLWPNLVVTTEMRERVDDVMELIGATLLRRRLFGEMSAGQQRRVLIGRALVASSECLLLDEPSNALDLRAQSELRELLIALAERGTTLLHVTHHIADIIPAMKRVVMMKDGSIFADGHRGELLTEEKLSGLFATEVHLAEHGGSLHAW